MGFTKNESHMECFLINLSNGNILITDQMFNTIIKIPSLRNSSVII